MQEAVEVEDEDDPYSMLDGATIVSCRKGRGGCHMELDDGKTLILVGFVVVLQQPDGPLQ